MLVDLLIRVKLCGCNWICSVRSAWFYLSLSDVDGYLVDSNEVGGMKKMTSAIHTNHTNEIQLAV